MNGFQNFLKRLAKVSPFSTDDECDGALNPENQSKNRSRSIYPSKGYLFVLVVCSSYANLVVVVRLLCLSYDCKLLCDRRMLVLVMCSSCARPVFFLCSSCARRVFLHCSPSMCYKLDLVS